MRKVKRNKHFSDGEREAIRLKNMFDRERNKLKKALLMRDYFYNLMEETKEELKNYQLRSQMEIQSSKKTIDELTEENIKLRKRVDRFDDNEDKINEIHKNLNRIHIQAEVEASDLISDAKGKVMDIFFAAEKMNKQVDILKKDMISLEKDLSIGSDTMIERVEAFYDDIDKYKNKITELKREFYKENKVPLDLSD